MWTPTTKMTANSLIFFCFHRVGCTHSHSMCNSRLSLTTLSHTMRRTEYDSRATGSCSGPDTNPERGKSLQNRRTTTVHVKEFPNIEPSVRADICSVPHTSVGRRPWLRIISAGVIMRRWEIIQNPPPEARVLVKQGIRPEVILPWMLPASTTASILEGFMFNRVIMFRTRSTFMRPPWPEGNAPGGSRCGSSIACRGNGGIAEGQMLPMQPVMKLFRTATI